MHRLGFITAVLVLCGSQAGVQADIAVTYRNGLNMPGSATDQNGVSFTVTGLSGLTALADGRFAAVMDNSNKIVFFRPVLASDGSVVSVTQVTGLSMSQSRDFEDIALLPQTGSAVICDEGAASPLSYVDLQSGAVSTGPAVPAVFANVRSNLGLESVTISPDGLTMWTCNEEALTVDGAVPTSSAGTRVRVQRFDRAASGVVGGFSATGQWCYITQPLHGAAITNARNGVSAMVALPGGELLTMERSYAFGGAGLFLTRMYTVSFAGVTETSGIPALAGVLLTPCGKRSLFDANLGNLEGLALGPATGDGTVGRRVLLGVVDDGDPISTSRLVSFVIDGVASGCGQADFGSQGGVLGPDGVLDNNDFIVFINEFFNGSSRADLGSQGGVAPGDGQFDNNDFIVFIDWFFAGC